MFTNKKVGRAKALSKAIAKKYNLNKIMMKWKTLSCLNKIST